MSSLSAADKRKFIQDQKAEAEFEKLSKEKARQQARRGKTLAELEAEEETEREGRLSEFIRQDDVDRSKTLPFIFEPLTRIMPLIPRRIYMIGAGTGRGKSTITANVVFTLVQAGKRVLVIVNEDTELEVLQRLACLDRNINYNALQNGRIKDRKLNGQIMLSIMKIKKLVRVVDDQSKNSPTTLDGFTATLEEALQFNYDAIVVDFYQNIRPTVGDESERYNTLAAVKTFLMDYRKRMNCPMIMCAQLKPLSKNCLDFESRIKWCTEIKEVLHGAIEFCRDDDKSFFRIAKQRTGENEGTQIEVKFLHGRYYPAELTPPKDDKAAPKEEFSGVPQAKSTPTTNNGQ